MPHAVAAARAGNSDRLEAHARNEISTLQNRGGLTQAIRGGVLDLSYDTKQIGNRIAQDNASRNLTDDNASADWRPATGVSAGRPDNRADNRERGQHDRAVARGLDQPVGRHRR
jgi:hypothetical protein